MAKNSESIDVMQHAEMLSNVGVTAKEAGNQIVEGLRRLASAGEDKSTGNGDLYVKIDLDVSDALKGLKAIQREAKKTGRILREVEERTDIKDLTDDEILDELSSRGWDVNKASFYAGSEEPTMRHIEKYKNNEQTGGTHI